VTDEVGLIPSALPHNISDLTRDLRQYLTTAGWQERPPGPGGALWFRGPAEESRALAVPVRVEPDSTEWHGVLDRLAVFEQRPLRDVYLSITTQFVDVTRFRTVGDDRISGSLPLTAGAQLVDSVHTMLRAAATTSQSPRSHISGNYSRSGEELAAQARMAHTEEGSYILPVWMPLTPPIEAEPDLGMEFHRASEPPERRVTRTLAQAINAVNEVLIKPERETKSSDVSALVPAGVSRELVNALHRVLVHPTVQTVEATFDWASALHSPGGIGRSVSMDATAAGRLKHAADALRVSRRHPAEVITGLIVEIRHTPGDLYGEVAIDTIRRGRPSEIRVRVTGTDLQNSFIWAPNERPMLVEGAIETTKAHRLLIARPNRFLPLNETFLSDDSS